MDAISMIRIGAFAGFFVCAFLGNIVLLRLLGERRGRSVSGLRVLFFPFLVAPEAFTYRGRQLYSRFKSLFAWAFVCWIIFVVTMFA